MALNLDANAQRALDLAKRAVPADGELDFGLLMAALCQSTALKDRLPAALAERLPVVPIGEGEVPETVAVATDLQPVIRSLKEQGHRLNPELLFKALLDSPAGGTYLRGRGVATNELRALSEALAGNTAVASGWRASTARREAMAALGSYGRMLTAVDLPDHGVYGMKQAIDSLVRTLSRWRSRNAIITGHPGTGKSAVIYEFARRLVQDPKRFPEGLRDVDVFELSPSFLRSGASVMGQYDERVKALLQVLEANPKIFLFVDEIHSLFQSGVHERGPYSDANESFKGRLGRGEITCIGCTTISEYRHYIAPDQALARRFTEIRLDPPTPEATLEILRARRQKMVDYFAHLRIPDDMLVRAVQLTEEYRPSRFQPEKSLRLVDEACAYCVTTEPPLPELTEAALWKALEDVIGHSVLRGEGLTETALYEQLRERIIGQDDALHTVARAVIAGLGNWGKHTAPRSVLLFCGPTGVGKTETAVLLSRIVGGSNEAMVRVNCNTLQSSGRDLGPVLNVLLGPPPGYLGYVRGQGGVLSKIRDYPESVVLFDEIEKADPGVAKLLLQIMDEGRIDDQEGNPLDFRRAFIVFTTNAGSVYHQKPIGFTAEDTAAGTPSTDVSRVREELRALGYADEFLGRIGHTVVFRGLDRASIRSVIERQLIGLRESADVKGYTLEWDPELVEHLAGEWQPRFGVRYLTTILRNRVVEQLSVLQAQNELQGVKRIRLVVMAPDSRNDKNHPVGRVAHRREPDTLIIELD
jgi:ATP-dependent Clp protease ATP-binding subunit ClpC